MRIEPPRRAIPSVALFRIWFGIGIQSFGGGTTTMTLIRRNSVDIHGWITEEQFNRDWALCQMTPGINLIALTILVGRQIAGPRGVIVCLTGLLLPSAFLTAALTAGYVSIRSLPAVQACLRGILPASVGLGLLTAFQMAKGPVQSSWRMGWPQFLFVSVILAGSAALLAMKVVPVTTVLILGGFIGALEGALRARFAPGGSTT
ncbi:MAG: chromate transporter [Fimbriimonas sp.]|nr:chromate transporter [Fimbriimonas sp.]